MHQQLTKNKKLSKSFLSNGFYRGIPNDLEELSESEACLISIFRPYCRLISIRSYKDETVTPKFCGNAVPMQQDPKVVSQVLPLQIKDLPLYVRVIFAGTGDIPKHLIRHVVHVRLRVIWKWLKFLKEVNSLYDNITISNESEYDTSLLDKNNIPTNIFENVIPSANKVDSQSDYTRYKSPVELQEQRYKHILSSYTTIIHRNSSINQFILFSFQFTLD